jgi:predicted dehydrogenase
VKLLVVGVGSIGRKHAMNAVNYSVVGIVDSNDRKADEVAKECNSISFGDDLEKALKWGCDGVIVATPNKFHIEVAIKAIKSGADVLIEKPISYDTKLAKEFLDYAESINRKVYVVCNMRFHPAVNTLQKYLHIIGKPLFARAHYGNYLPDQRPNTDYRKLYVSNAEEGGVVLDAIHELDYLSWFFGSIKNIFGDVSHISSLEIKSDDYAGLIVKHESNVRSEIHLDYLRRVKRRGCEISGADGLLHWISEGKSPEHCIVRSYTPDFGWKILLDEPDLDDSSSMKNLIKEFVLSLNGKQNRLQTGQEALILLNATLAARTGDESARKIS